MMKINLALFVGFLTLYSCSGVPETEHQPKSFNEKQLRVVQRRATMTFLDVWRKNFENPISYENVKMIGRDSIYITGKKILFETFALSDICCNQAGKYYLFNHPNNNQIIRSDTLFPISLSEGGEVFAIGIVAPFRSRGRLSVLLLVQNQFLLVKQFDEIVYNYSLDCQSYTNRGWLAFMNEDVNGDGLLDLKFSGRILHFCDGLEEGYGRLDRSPIRSDTVEYTYIAESNKSHLVTWSRK